MTAPSPFAEYLDAWNTKDQEERARLLAHCVSDDVEFVDPRTVLRGRAALADEMAENHQRVSGFRVARTSGVDRHHDRARYAWSVFSGDVRVLDGFDAVQLDADGRLMRIDGFFGSLPEG